MSRPNRRRAVRAVAPVAGLLAAGLLVWQGSYAAFSATTTSPSNNWTAGQVSLFNSSNNYAAAVGTATWAAANNLKPTSTDTKCITVKSTGSLAGPVRLYVNNVAQTNADNLQFTIKVMNAGVTASNVTAACAGFAATSTLATNVALSAIPTSYVGPPVGYGGWTTAGTGPATPEYAAYQISWTVPAGAPSSIQGGTASADFVWEIQNS